MPSAPKRRQSTAPNNPFDFEASQTSEVQGSRQAEEYALTAENKLNECQAHLAGFQTHLKEVAREGLELIDAALAINQDSADYWNIKGLLLADGLCRHDEGIRCLKKALALKPSSIVFRQNLRRMEGGKRKVRALWIGITCAAVILVAIIIACMLFLPSDYDLGYRAGQEHRRLGSDPNAALTEELDRRHFDNVNDAMSFMKGFQDGYEGKKK